MSWRGRIAKYVCQEKEWQTDRGKIQSNTDSKRRTKNDITSDKCDR